MGDDGVNLFHLVRFRIASRPLQVDQFLASFPVKNVMAATHPFVESQVQKKASQVVEANAGVATAAKNPEQGFSCRAMYGMYHIDLPLDRRSETRRFHHRRSDRLTMKPVETEPLPGGVPMRPLSVLPAKAIVLPAGRSRGGTNTRAGGGAKTRKPGAAPGNDDGPREHPAEPDWSSRMACAYTSAAEMVTGGRVAGGGIFARNAAAVGQSQESTAMSWASGLQNIFQRARIGAALCLMLSGMMTADADSPSVQRDSRVGKKIIVTTAGAELRTPEATVWKAYPGEVFTIALVNGEWLWIQEKGGWMWEKDGVLFDRAIAVMSDRLSKQPTAEAYNLRGVVFVAHGQYERALKDFTESLVREPGNAGVYNNRGQCHYFMKQYAQALADFTQALAISPNHVVALNNRALVHIARKDYLAALDDIQKALTIHPKYAEALLNRGLIRQKTGHPEQAVEDYTAAIELDPRFAAAWLNRAFARRSLKRYQAAVADLRQAMKLAPDSFEPVNDLAYTLATAADDDVRDAPAALALAEQARQMAGEDHWNILDTLAVARAAVNDFTGAEQAIRQALELVPESDRDIVLSHQKQIAARQAIRE